MVKFLTIRYCGPSLTFPIDQRAKAVEGEQLKVSQTLRIRRAGLHFQDM